MKRLHAQKEDTVVFSGTLAGIEQAKAAGFRTVAVYGSAGAADWDAMQNRNGVNGLLFAVLHQIVAPHQQNHDDHNKSGKKDDC